tara:strand:- start:52 stop:270 length:219 start_codon:yes stop_codon:yes gene_type:complete
MNETTKQVIEAVASNPKTSTVITAAVTSNVWLDYGEPAVKVVTSLLGLVVLVLLVVKHALDIKKEHFTHNDK